MKKYLSVVGFATGEVQNVVSTDAGTYIRVGRAVGATESLPTTSDTVMQAWDGANKTVTNAVAATTEKAHNVLLDFGQTVIFNGNFFAARVDSDGVGDSYVVGARPC